MTNAGCCHPGIKVALGQLNGVADEKTGKATNHWQSKFALRPRPIGHASTKPNQETPQTARRRRSAHVTLDSYGSVSGTAGAFVYQPSIESSLWR